MSTASPAQLRPFFEQALRELELTTDHRWIMGEFNPALPGAGWEEFRQIWQAAAEKPDGILITNDLLFSGAAQAIRELRIDVPEMVLIPGGKFTMGSDAGDVDEKPRHEVTVSGFAMAKYEVTNEEFERFDPAHRSMRNGNSWRDREPVVAVNWEDAVKYCNWLSEKARLTPVYKESGKHTIPYINGSFWTMDSTADGFRLPTEAEWEYEASGRGEDRKYPWGDAEPVPYVHGNFMSKADAQGPRQPRRSVDANGVVVVGSYPAGASRDGILDMAGNVAEWCFDFYNCPYPAEAQADPASKTPSVYQVIRGGSWSYYGSQRATDRDYNTATYPGHAFYGFRVVVSEAGRKKLGETKGR